jgi:lipopolysaccharide export system protein LptA
MAWKGFMNKFLLSLFLVFLSSFILHAADRDEPIHVRAQSASLDEIKGYSKYLGEVNITQGTLILKGQEVQIFNNEKEVTKVIANGDSNQQAYYKQDRPNQERFIEARADKITYIVNEEMVHLEGGAYLLQGYDKFTGGTLDYDIKNDRVIAKKSEDGKERVKFKIRL